MSAHPKEADVVGNGKARKAVKTGKVDILLPPTA